MQRLAGAIGVAIVVAAGGASRADTVTVNVFHSDFSLNLPGSPTQDAVINVGDTVRWNFINTFHTTTSAVGQSESWNSNIIFSVPSSFEHTFTHTGVFHYHCSLHGFDLGDGTSGGMAGTVTVLGGPACDSVDFNQDGLVPDVQDIADFLHVFSGGGCPTASCGDIDFNNDGLFPDVLDIDAFLSVFAGGPCV